MFYRGNTGERPYLQATPGGSSSMPTSSTPTTAGITTTGSGSGVTITFGGSGTTCSAQLRLILVTLLLTALLLIELYL